MTGLGATLEMIRDCMVIVAGPILIVIMIVTLRRLVPLLIDLHQLSREMTTALKSFQEMSAELEDTIVSARALTDAISETHRKSMEPVMRNVEEMTRELNLASRQLADAVDEGVQFSRSTVRQATFYRDKIFRPLIEAASLWSGARAVLKALPTGRFRRLKRSRKERSK
ncbi:MAG: hypothetical protein OXT69_06555 [Candidatus Poribacteria bacterium]|nr:hypothetical protein [Candidatus Poribacteria bacterium]